MSENSLDTSNGQISEEQKKDILSRLKKEPKAETALAYLKEGRSELEEKILAGISETMSEAEKDLWFPKEETRIDLERVTSDLRDIKQWSEILKKYKEGAYTEETMVDFIALSHVSVTDEPNPINVLERQVRDGLKSRTGATFVQLLTGAVSNAWEETVTNLVQLLPEETRSSFKPVKLLAAATEGDQKNAIIPLKEEIHQFVKEELALITPDYTEQLVKELFVGDMLYDRLIELDYEELVEKLKDPDDLDFSSIRTIIVDAGYESSVKAHTRKEAEGEGEVVDTGEKKFVIYIAWLKNIFEGFKGTNSQDRGIDKFRLSTDITFEQFREIMSLIQERYYRYIDGRFERSALDKEWLSPEEIRKVSKYPEYHIDPTTAVGIVRNLVSGLRSIYESLPAEGVSPAHWQEIHQTIGESVYEEFFEKFLKNDKNK